MNLPRDTIGMSGTIIPLVGWSPRERFVQTCRYELRYENDKTFESRKVLGTNSGNMVSVMSPTAQQDTFVDNELGETLRLVKAKSGKALFIEAYKKARNTSKTINDRRKKCLEEEVRLRSVLRAGED